MGGGEGDRAVADAAAPALVTSSPSTSSSSAPASAAVSVELQHAHRERLFSKRLISGHVKPRLGRLRVPKARSGGGLLGFVKRSYVEPDLGCQRRQPGRLWARPGHDMLSLSVTSPMSLTTATWVLSALPAASRTCQPRRSPAASGLLPSPLDINGVFGPKERPGHQHLRSVRPTESLVSRRCSSKQCCWRLGQVPAQRRVGLVYLSWLWCCCALDSQLRPQRSVMQRSGQYPSGPARESPSGSVRALRRQPRAQSGRPGSITPLVCRW